MTKAEKDAECKRRWREKNPDYGKQHYQKNKQEYIDRAAQWRRDNPERRKQIRQRWEALNPDKSIASKAKWVSNNHDKVLAAERKRRTIPSNKIKFAVASRIRSALKKRKGGRKTTSILGCSITDLMLYLESKFDVGMTWENYGTVWHIDHIMPCAIFDMMNPDHIKACFHFSNLQPLFAHDNLTKHAKVTTNQFNLL